ncbi:DUF4397 domain-containing protein [Haloarchaeobius sp. TZWWS8]|uniref:DUF4397 domain-containing protein n=1 Tax=Haloarchaeobius sp. TZWWS8 TaxID=3446121 RepID=UPI003EBC90E3
MGGTFALGGLGSANVLAHYHEAKGKDEDGMGETTPTMASVRVIHASPDAPNVDVYVDGEKVLSDVPFSTVSEYLDLEPGKHQLKITAAGDVQATVFDAETDIPEGSHTVIATGELNDGTFKPILLTDPTEMELQNAADQDAALVRVAHASPDAPAVQVIVGPDSEDASDEDVAVIESISFGESSDYMTVPAGATLAEVYPAEDVEAEALKELKLDLEAGSAHTVLAIGYLSPEEDQPSIEFLTTEDGIAHSGEEDEPLDEDELEDGPVDEEEMEDGPFDEGEFEDDPFDEGEFEDEPIDEEELEDEPVDEEEQDQGPKSGINWFKSMGTDTCPTA